MQNAIKKKFKIKKIQRGFIVTYQAYIKNIIWFPFWCGYDGDKHYIYNPSLNISHELQSIQNYCDLKGWEDSEVTIETDS